jgi:hypothetical protein
MHSLINKIGLFALILMFSNCLPSTTTSPYTGGLEMWEEPRHQLVFSKDNFSFMDVLIPGRDTCLFHIHRHPTFYVMLNGASYAAQNWGQEWEHFKQMDYVWAGMALDMSEPYTTSTPNVRHRITVPEDETYHLVAMINTGNGVPTANPSSGGLMSTVNNKWFRENRFEVDAGQKSKSIQMEYHGVLVQYTEGATSILENGIEHSFKTEKGAYSYHAADQPFQISNQSDQEQKFVFIEAK